ncbi:hypothetical protein MOQ_008296 [Trypanosoma cruzi marinkellei]|uniref:Uncharacterized protein n=1 Tax=Trypanosoma cruzi marinkellei TaxID=85056 RepID=K2MQN6_TRYCR|nr:hypothetical protein MOQ_008296 [Trypanosoma cruzi marinkellei]
MSVPGPSWRMKNLGVQPRCPAQFQAVRIGLASMQKLLIAINGTTAWRPSALSKARHNSPPPLPRAVGMRPIRQRRLGDPEWRGELHDAPGKVGLSLGLRGTQWLTRGIGGRQGFVREIAVAPFDGVLECMLDATTGHSSWRRLGSLFRRRLRQIPACRQPWGDDAPWACAIRGGEIFVEPCQLAGRLRTLSRMDPPDSEKECWRRIQDIQGAIELPRNGTALSTRQFREQRRSMPHPCPMKQNAANVVGLDNTTRRAE